MIWVDRWDNFAFADELCLCLNASYIQIFMNTLDIIYSIISSVLTVQPKVKGMRSHIKSFFQVMPAQDLQGLSTQYKAKVFFHSRWPLVVAKLLVSEEKIKFCNFWNMMYHSTCSDQSKTHGRLLWARTVGRVLALQPLVF